MRNPDMTPFKQWLGVLERTPSIIPKSYGEAAQPVERLLEHCNEFINTCAYRADGLRDSWKTLPEFLADNGGDCEDFAIAKYFYLSAEGVADERMDIIVLPRRIDRVIHSVLRVDGWYLDIYDNALHTWEEFKSRYAVNSGMGYGINRNGWVRI
jgi:predicted transglutaminase-like cysteine proteinase